jgi:DnaK suppressor protein
MAPKMPLSRRQPTGGPQAAKGMALKEAVTKTKGFQEILERSEAELDRVLRNRDGIAIEKSADQMDEIQYASERDLAIRNVDRESRLLLQVRAALRRIRDGSFGTCIDCESAISPKRLSAVPSAPRCIECQAAVDRGEHQGTESLGETLVNSM